MVVEVGEKSQSSYSFVLGGSIYVFLALAPAAIQPSQGKLALADACEQMSSHKQM